LNTGLKILSYNIHVSFLHNTLVKFGVSTCHFVSNSLIMAQLGRNILVIHYNSWGIPPQGADWVFLNDSIHLGPSHILPVSSAWVLPRWWVFTIQKTHSVLDSTTWYTFPLS